MAEYGLVLDQADIKAWAATNSANVQFGQTEGKLSLVAAGVPSVLVMEVCGFKETVDFADVKKCKELGLGVFNKDPFGDINYQCLGGTLGMDSKQKYVCSKEAPTEPKTPYADFRFFFLLFGSSLLLCVSTCFCYSVHRCLMMKHYQVLNMQQAPELQNRQGEPERPRSPRSLVQEQQRLKKALERLKKKIGRVRFAQSELQEQATCSICVEEFKKHTWVRETPCSHLFHDECLVKWISTKVDEPDCPFCRAELKF